jgi:hypothetical protein
MSPMWNITTGLFGLIRLQSFWHYLLEFLNYNLIQPTISLEMPVPSQGHCGFHSFPVVDWFCQFMTFPLEYCSEFGNFVITLMTVGFWLLCLTATFNNISVYHGGQFYWWRNRRKPPNCHWQTWSHNVMSSTPRLSRDDCKYCQNFIILIALFPTVPTNFRFEMLSDFPKKKYDLTKYHKQ